MLKPRLILAGASIPLAMHILALPAQGALVKGSLESPEVVPTVRSLGSTKTRVAAPAANAGETQSIGLFLSAKDSLPLPKPTSFPEVFVEGLGFEPSVVTCPVDGKVTFTNHDSKAVTLRVGGEKFGRIGPSESKTYECAPGPSGKEFRGVRVDEWPHMRGWIYVGELGVSAQIDASRQFKVAAPEGTYELLIIGSGVILLEEDVIIGKSDIDLGKIALAPGGTPTSAQQTAREARTDKPSSKTP